MTKSINEQRSELVKELDNVIQKCLNKDFSLDVTMYEVICMRNDILKIIQADRKRIVEPLVKLKGLKHGRIVQDSIPSVFNAINETLKLAGEL